MVIQSFGCEAVRKPSQDPAVGQWSPCSPCLPLDGAREGKVLIRAPGSFAEGPEPEVSGVDSEMRGLARSCTMS